MLERLARFVGADCRGARGAPDELEAGTAPPARLVRPGPGSPEPGPTPTGWPAPTRSIGSVTLGWRAGPSRRSTARRSSRSAVVGDALDLDAGPGAGRAGGAHERGAVPLARRALVRLHARVRRARRHQVPEPVDRAVLRPRRRRELHRSRASCTPTTSSSWPRSSDRCAPSGRGATLAAVRGADPRRGRRVPLARDDRDEPARRPGRRRHRRQRPRRHRAAPGPRRARARSTSRSRRRTPQLSEMVDGEARGRAPAPVERGAVPRDRAELVGRDHADRRGRHRPVRQRARREGARLPRGLRARARRARARPPGRPGDGRRGHGQGVHRARHPRPDPGAGAATPTARGATSRRSATTCSTTRRSRASSSPAGTSPSASSPKRRCGAATSASGRWSRTSPTSITIVGPEGRLIYSSPAAERLFGFEEGDESWTDPMARVHPDDLDRVVDGDEPSSSSSGGTDPVSFRLRVADGSYRDVEAIVQDLTDDPSVGGIVATTRDVTERARAEAMVASQAQILRLIAEGAPLAETLGDDLRGGRGAGPRRAVLGDAGRRGRARAPRSARHRACRPSTSRAVDGVPDRAASRARAAPPRTTARRSWSRTSSIDPRWDGCRELAAEHGLRACWSTPIFASSGDRVLGTFAVYHREPQAPTRRGRGDRGDGQPARGDRDRAPDVRGPARAPGAARPAHRAAEPRALRRVPHAGARARRSAASPRPRCCSSTWTGSRS